MFDKELYMNFIDSINREIRKFYKDGICSNDLIIIHVPEKLFDLTHQLSSNTDSNYIRFGGVLLLFLKNKEDEFSSDLISGIGNAY